MGHDLGRFHAYLACLRYADLTQFHGIDTPGIYQQQIDIFQTHQDLSRGDWAHKKLFHVKTQM